KDPVVDDAWFEKGEHGVHINAMGSNREQRRELPSRLVHRADLIAVDSVEVAKLEAGDLILAPVDWSDRRIVELAKIEHRPAGAPITIFKSCGLGWKTWPPPPTSTNALLEPGVKWRRMGFEDYKVVLYRNQPDGWVAEIPSISGCYALMPTIQEALG